MMKERLKADSIIYFWVKLIPSGINFISISIFIRLIGSEEFGKYVLLMTLVFLSGSIGFGWICQGIIRFSSVYRSADERRSFHAAISSSILYSLLFTTFFLFLITLVLKIAFESLFGVAALFFLFLYTVDSAIVQTEFRPMKILWIESVRAITALIVPLIIYIIFRSGGYRLPFYGLIAGYAVAWLLLRARSFKFDKTAVSSSMRSQMWNYGWPMTLWFGFSYLLNVSDRYLIEYFMGLHAVGVYSAVYDVTTKTFTLLMMPVMTASQPLITHLWNSGEKAQTVRLLNKAAKYQMLIFVPLIPLLYFASPLIVRLILGKAEPAAAAIILPVSAGAFLWNFSMLMHKPLELHLRTGTMAIFAGIALAANVLGNVLLLPRYGYLAAAYTTVGGSLIYIALVFGYYKRMVANYKV